MSEYYDKEGNPIGIYKWTYLFVDADYRKVKQTTLKNGKFVSTIWLGLNHGKPGEKLIFETMVFSDDTENSVSLDCVRYSTIEEAIKGHEEMCKKWEKIEN
jgi:hypothetical protein